MDPADQWVPPSGSGGRGAGCGAMAAGMAVPGAGSGAVPVAVPGAGSGSVPAATRLQAYAWCREFLAGSWKLIGPDDFAIAPVRYGGRRGVPPVPSGPSQSLQTSLGAPGWPPWGPPVVPRWSQRVPLVPHYPPITSPGRPLMPPLGPPVALQ